jgi:GNAT superfamily N-acetyltransferase
MSVLDDPTLVALSDLNYLEANRELARRAGGTVLDEDGLVCWAGAHALPVLANGAMRTKAGMPADEVLARARRFFAARGRGFSVIARGAADADLRAACEAAGMVQMGEPPGLVLERRIADAQPPAGVTLRVVETPADAAAFAAVSGAAYATYGMPRDVAPAVLGRLDVMRAPHIVSVVGFAGDEPASAAMVMLTHGVGGVYWVGTTPAARGKGLAELCTRAVSNAAFDLGARAVVLQASPMGDPIYRRMGYREVTRYPHWVQLTPLAA